MGQNPVPINRGWDIYVSCVGHFCPIASVAASERFSSRLSLFEHDLSCASWQAACLAAIAPAPSGPKASPPPLLAPRAGGSRICDRQSRRADARGGEIAGREQRHDARARLLDSASLRTVAMWSRPALECESAATTSPLRSEGRRSRSPTSAAHPRLPAAGGCRGAPVEGRPAPAWCAGCARPCRPLDRAPVGRRRRPVLSRAPRGTIADGRPLTPRRLRSRQSASGRGSQPRRKRQ